MENNTGRDEITFDMMKMEETIHFICSTCKPEDRLGAVKLNKILYYSDMTSFAETGKSITGATYAKRQNGPVPKQVTEAIDNLRRAGRLETRNVSVFEHVRRQFDARGATDVSIFHADEIARVGDMITAVCEHTANEISEISHTLVWRVADMGEDLPYESYFVSYLDDLTTEDQTVVAGALARAKENGRIYA